jgi:hypothetical protein
MKKIAALILVICMGIIVYFLIKEEINGVVLSHSENIILSVTYILIGVCVFIFYRIKFSEKKKNG